MTRASVRQLRHLDRTGYQVSIRHRPEPFRRELLGALAWLAAGVVLALVVSVAS